MLKHLSDEDILRIRKKIKEEAKAIRTGKKREFYLAEYIHGSNAVAFLSSQHENFMNKFKEENERAWNYLNDKEEAEKFGFFDERDFKVGGKYFGQRIPNQKPEQISEWAAKAYPQIESDLWAFQTEVEAFNVEMTSRNLPLFVLE